MSNFKHGMSNTPTYVSWRSMKDRCLNNKNKKHEYYERIKICKKWMVFSNFLADMGERPDGKTLDRVNNNKGYNKYNCRWANRSIQNSNRSGYSNTKQKHIYMVKIFKNLKPYTYFQVEVKDFGLNKIRASFNNIESAMIFRDLILIQAGNYDS